MEVPSRFYRFILIYSSYCHSCAYFRWRDSVGFGIDQVRLRVISLFDMFSGLIIGLHAFFCTIPTETSNEEQAPLMAPEQAVGPGLTTGMC